MNNVVGFVGLISFLCAIVSGLIAWASMLGCSQVFAVKIPERWTRAAREHTPAWYPLRDAVDALIAEGAIEELDDPVLARHARRYARSAKLGFGFGAMAVAAVFLRRFCLG
jgi:hypothetical protein